MPHETYPTYRIAVVGCSGSGKSTLAAKIAHRLGIEHVELDAYFHQPNWQPLDREEFVRRVRERTPANGQWVSCGNYQSSAGGDLVQRATHIVFLDYPWSLVMRRMVARSLGRVVRKTELWNGNRERPLNLLNPDPRQNIILWAATQWAPLRKRYASARQAEPGPAEVVHCRKPQDAEAF
ncbi:MAG: AAA family ATPase [Planctomycetota bacterium]